LITSPVLAGCALFTRLLDDVREHTVEEIPGNIF
jgi:hypothetical protein